MIVYTLTVKNEEKDSHSATLNWLEEKEEYSLLY